MGVSNMKNHERIAIIPARGGSKRIPRKNIKMFKGKPIIAYSIATALRSNCFSSVLVSTDDEEVATIARDCGASVPFMRSAETSSDTAMLYEVLIEVLKELEVSGQTFDSCCCILPCAPFLAVRDLHQSLELFEAKQADSVVPLVRLSFPI